MPTIEFTIMELTEIMAEPWTPSLQTIELMDSICTPMICNRGEILVAQGTRSHHFFIIQEGLCRSFYTGEKYEDTNLFAKDGDIIGSIASYFNSEPARFSIEALTPMSLLKVSFDDLKASIAQNSELSAWVRDLLFGQLNALEKRYTYRSGRGDAYYRYVSMIEKWPHNRFNDIPLKHIAQYLQITPQMLSKIRRRYLNEK